MKEETKYHVKYEFKTLIESFKTRQTWIFILIPFAVLFLLTQNYIATLLIVSGIIFLQIGNIKKIFLKITTANRVMTWMIVLSIAAIISTFLKLNIVTLIILIVLIILNAKLDKDSGVVTAYIREQKGIPSKADIKQMKEAHNEKTKEETIPGSQEGN